MNMALNENRIKYKLRISTARNISFKIISFQRFKEIIQFLKQQNNR